MEQGADLVVGELVELDGIHGGNKALDALGDGGRGRSRGGRRGRGRRSAELDGGGDARLHEAVEGGGAVEAVGLDEPGDGDDAGERGGEGVELGDELEALGRVVGGGDEVADVGALQLLRRLDDGVQVGEALQELPLPLVVPQLHLHLRRRRGGPLASLPSFSLSGERIAVGLGFRRVARDWGKRRRRRGIAMGEFRRSKNCEGLRVIVKRSV